MLPEERQKVEKLVYAKRAIAHMMSRTTADTHNKQVHDRIKASLCQSMGAFTVTVCL